MFVVVVAAKGKEDSRWGQGPVRSEARSSGARHDGRRQGMVADPGARHGSRQGTVAKVKAWSEARHSRRSQGLSRGKAHFLFSFLL